MTLTPKQELFAQAVFAGKSHSDAYRHAYDTSGMTEKSIHEEGSRTANHLKVASRIAELFGGLADDTKFTKEQAMREYEEARILASTMEKPNVTAMVAATNGKVEVAGLKKIVADVNVNIISRATIEASFQGLINEVQSHNPAEDCEGIVRT